MANFGNYGSGKFNQILVKDLTVTDDVTISGDWAVTGTLAVTSTSTFTGAVSIDDTTATTSGITGSLHTDGGVGIAGALYVGTTSALVGNVTVGSASGAGADVRFYGDLATADFFWDQDGDINGSLTLGADTKGVDFKAFDVTTGNYLIWDQSADDLLLVGTSTQFAVAGTTNATTSTTGSLRTAGGLGVALNTFLGGTTNFGGNVTGGVSGTGVDVTLYGDTAGCDFFWDMNGATNTGLLQLGASTTGVDFIAYGTTAANYLHWDHSGDDLLLVGTSTQLAVAGTTTSTNATTGSLRTAGGLGVAGTANFGSTVGIIGAVTISPAAAGTFLDFALETEWVSGTLIRADFGGATTLNDDVVGQLMDFNTQVTMTTDKDVKVLQVKLPALSQTAANTTVITGIDLPTAGALVQSSGAGTITWKGVNLQLPNTTASAGTVNSYGMYITQGTVTSGTQYGIYMAGGAAYLPMQVGVKASTSGSGLKIVGNGDNSGGVQLYADDGGAAAAGEVITPLRVRYLLTAAQSGGVTQTATFSQLVTLGTTGAPLVLNTGAWRASYVFAQLGGTTIQGGAEVVGINQATTLAGNMIVTSGRFSGVDINIAGDGTITNNSVCAALLIRSSGTPVWPNGLQVTSALVGINMATTTQGVVSVVSALPANARGDSFKYTCATPAMTDGYGAFETDLTISGTATGHAAAASTWVNIPSGATIPNALNIYTPHNDGIWEDSAATLSGGILAFGARMQADIGDASGWDILAPWSINTSKAITALIHSANPTVDLAYQAASPTAAAVGSIPFMVANNGTVLYMRLYTDATT